jgi:hypothetical protein
LKYYLHKYKKGSVMNFRNLINLVEAKGKGCPVATHDIELNLKNRQTAIDKYHYGPANPDKSGSYWKDSAKIFKVDEATAKTMQCANCAAFDVSDSMRQCIIDGIKGDETTVDAAASINLADLGYCNFLHFKCAGARSCSAWLTGGPITEKDKGKKAD